MIRTNDSSLVLVHKSNDWITSTLAPFNHWLTQINEFNWYHSNETHDPIDDLAANDFYLYGVFAMIAEIADSVEFRCYTHNYDVIKKKSGVYKNGARVK